MSLDRRKYTFLLFFIVQDSDQEKFQELAKFAMLHEDGTDPEILRKIREDEHVFIEWKSFLDLRMKREHKLTGFCDYSLAPEEFFTERVALAFPKDMQWVDRFNQ
jgi:hypothetical protein